MEYYYNTDETPSADDSRAVNAQSAESVTLTRAEVAQMIDEKLSALRIYVLESDITDAQNSRKAIVERASF